MPATGPGPDEPNEAWLARVAKTDTVLGAVDIFEVAIFRRQVVGDWRATSEAWADPEVRARQTEDLDPPELDV